MSATILQGDCLDILPTLEAGSVHTCVTSPPYYGLRDYGCADQIGLEETPDAYVQKMVEVFRQVRRVLRDDGTVWLNLGDSYNNFRVSQDGQSCHNLEIRQKPTGRRRVDHDLKEKDLIGIPWRVAFALQADGWYLRSDIIWAKPNPMPESVKDRPTKAHEYIFLLSKQARYYYDLESIREPINPNNNGNIRAPDAAAKVGDGRYNNNERTYTEIKGANKRTVWTVATKPYPEAHFATYPPDLIEPCILAGAPEGGTVLDPFCGSGTTGMVALAKGRRFLGVELNTEYCELARRRIYGNAPLFNRAEVV